MILWLLPCLGRQALLGRCWEPIGVDYDMLEVKESNNGNIMKPKIYTVYGHNLPCDGVPSIVVYLTLRPKHNRLTPAIK